MYRGGTKYQNLPNKFCEREVKSSIESTPQDSILAVGPAAAAARLTAPPVALGLAPALSAAPTAPATVACHWPWFLGSQLAKAPLPPTLSHISEVRNHNIKCFYQIYTGVHFMVRSGFCEYVMKNLRYPACSRQDNAIIPPHIHGTRSAP